MNRFLLPRREGAALVLTLALLTLLTAIVLAFFMRITTDSRASRVFADTTTARGLGDSAVSVVMAQLREATTITNAAWASQPGMVRVYGGDARAPEKALAFYKLYSSHQLTVPASDLASYDPDAEIPTGATGWNHQPALWTDLNEPALVAEEDGSFAKRYPILDPGIAGKVEGFELRPDSADDSGRPGRMPARWLYVLRDGTLTAPDRSGRNGEEALWDAPKPGTAPPSRDNPIVGRVAFWADDDTSKVNVNTAAGFTAKDLGHYDRNSFAGSYWDQPRFSTVFDRGGVLDEDTGAFSEGEGGLAICQPLGHEYQRYPGHPATTSLGLVLGDAMKSESLYSLLPRIATGGSEGGTKRLLARTDDDLSIETGRLYASVDEFFFSSGRKGGRRQSATDASRVLDPSARDVITPAWVDRMRFFLTAHNRAPELNLWGRPRVTIWPVWADAKLRTPADNLITFCSTLGPATDPRLFLPQRQDPYSSTVDAQLPRNAVLYDYLRQLTTRAIPGYGKDTFTDKFGATDRDQILTEIFDYIRSANLRDSSQDQDLAAQADRDKYKFALRGVVVPLIFQRDGKETMGFGRFPSVSEVSLVFYHAGYVGNDGQTYLDPRLKNQRGVKANLLRAFVVLELLNPMQGYAPTRAFGAPEAQNQGHVIVHEITGLDAFRITTSEATSPLGFPATAKNSNRWASAAAPQGRNFGGYEGFMHRLREKDSETPGQPNFYPFQTVTPIRVPVGDKTFGFSGGKLTLRTLFGTSPIQTLKLEFPAGTFPAPTDDIWAHPGGFTHPKATLTDVKSLPRRIAWAMQPSLSPWNVAAGGDGLDYAGRWKQILQPGDTIRSLVAGVKSDPRTAAITRDASPFVPHPLYQSSTERHAQTLRTATGPIYLAGKDTNGRAYTTEFGTLTKLPPGHDYDLDRSPDLPATVEGVVRGDGQPGDWDTGLGNMSDGPYCGKPDEGNLAWRVFNDNQGAFNYVHPYYTWKFEDALDTFFSPNRQMTSPVLFGSLLAGKTRDWETLCFSPNPAGDGHRGNAINPRDHLLLDFFHMPIVEPYAISEPFSTAGKVNLNTRLAPFPWIRRTTALRAVLHGSRVTAVPAEDVEIYKDNANQKPLTKNYRYPVERDETIKGLDQVFDEYRTRGPDFGFYKSASDICERYLYPEGTTNVGPVKFQPGEQAIKNFWKRNTLTGDNVRERPYSDLVPRLTTKSNSYTVHLRTQVLRSPPASTDAEARVWRERPESITSEYRGESSIERYIDPADRRFDRTHPITREKGDYLDVDKQSLEPAYRFRVVSAKRFAPK